MSGPITVIVAANPVAALLSMAAINAATAVYESYENAAVLQHAHQKRNDSRQNAQNTSSVKGQQALMAEADAAETAFDETIILAEKLGLATQARATRPQKPDANDREAVAAYIRILRELVAQLRNILLTEAARQAEQFAEIPDSALDSALDNVTEACVPQDLVQRLLKRIAHLGAAPHYIQTIAQELTHILPGERYTLLAAELRMQIQTYIEDMQKQQVQAATAVIVEQSLKDLGYQVEEISDTLFVEGGVAHFRKQGWGNYMVRMRVDAKASSANFNVVRAVAEGDNERSVLDHLAEDRWCAEFPALLQALAARGIHLNVTRRLEAGELPVQLVDADKLPTFAEEEAAVTNSQPIGAVHK